MKYFKYILNYLYIFFQIFTQIYNKMRLVQIDFYKRTQIVSKCLQMLVRGWGLNIIGMSSPVVMSLHAKYLKRLELGGLYIYIYFIRA